MLGDDEKPDVQYSDIGGMDIQKQEMREAVELPLTHFQLYEQIGIDPPRGVLMCVGYYFHTDSHPIPVCLSHMRARLFVSSVDLTPSSLA
jgi:hypothetical protein